MEYLEPKLEDTAADSLQKDLGEKAHIEGQLAAMRERLHEIEATASTLETTKLKLEIGRALMALDRGDESWPVTRPCFDIFIKHEQWEYAADTCDVLYRCNQDDSLSALGHGVWLGVTFPIDPDLSIAMLQHIVEDTPEDSDGAAVAAATASFLADVRATGKQQEKLQFFTGQLLAQVARRHSEIENQDQFIAWIEKLELNDPDKFLVRLRNVVDVLVQDDWWIDRDEIRAKIPAN